MKRIEQTGTLQSARALSVEEQSLLYGGGVVDFFKDAGAFIGHYVGYAAGVVKDAIQAHGQQVVESGGAASVMAFK